MTVKRTAAQAGNTKERLRERYSAAVRAWANGS
jgi:hypothetical protein